MSEAKWQYDFEIGCADKYDFWYFAMQFNGLFHFNVNSGVHEYLGKVPFEAEYGDRLYGSMHYNCGKLYLIPMSADYLAIYDIKEKTFDKIQVKDPDKSDNKYLKQYKWQCSVACNNKIYLFGLSHPAIVILDLQTNELTYNTEWLNQLKTQKIENENGTNKFYFEKSAVVDKKLIYIPLGSSNNILIYNTETNACNFITVGDKKDVFNKIVKTRDILWLSSKYRDSGIIAVKLSGDMNLSHISTLACPTGTIMFSKKKNILYIIPTIESNGYEYKIETNTICESEILKGKNKSFNWTQTDYGFVFYTKSTNQINVYNEEREELSEFNLYKDNLITGILKRNCAIIARKGSLSENSEITLRNYIESILDI